MTCIACVQNYTIRCSSVIELDFLLFLQSINREHAQTIRKYFEDILDEEKY